MKPGDHCLVVGGEYNTGKEVVLVRALTHEECEQQAKVYYPFTIVPWWMVAAVNGSLKGRINCGVWGDYPEVAMRETYLMPLRDDGEQIVNALTRKEKEK